MTAAAATKPDRRRLAHLLRAAHSPLDPDGVAELVAGVLAAPEEIGASWHRLVADPTPPALAEALEELRAHMAAGYHDGLSREDFARLPRPARLARLREVLAARRLDGFIVPRADEYQGEYVPPAGQRLAWLTGFTGSAGLAIVLRDRAALFVDGRYTLQAAAQVDTALFEIRHLVDEPAWRWLAEAAHSPRRRRAAHAPPLVLRDPAPGWQRQSVHRPPQARPRSRSPSRQRRHDRAARPARPGARRIGACRRARAGRSGDRRVLDFRSCVQSRRPQSPRRRSVP